MRKLLAVVAFTVFFAGCASERGDVYVANPCGTSRHVRLNYSASVPGGDMDALSGEIESGSTKSLGTLGSENLESARLEVFADAAYTRQVGSDNFGEPPEMQAVGDERIYLLFVPPDAC